jgi:hypothetical protein
MAGGRVVMSLARGPSFLGRHVRHMPFTAIFRAGKEFGNSDDVQMQSRPVCTFSSYVDSDTRLSELQRC